MSDSVPGAAIIDSREVLLCSHGCCMLCLRVRARGGRPVVATLSVRAPAWFRMLMVRMDSVARSRAHSTWLRAC
jgi:hypothetical protein